MTYYKKSNVASVERYKSKTYDRIDLYIPKGHKEEIESWLQKNDKTLNSIISEYLLSLIPEFQNDSEP